MTAIRGIVNGMDSSLPVTDGLTMGEVLEDVTRGRRLLLVLIASFAGLTLTLAMTGIYGMVSYQVTRRTRELGIRMALGAGRKQIFRLMFEQTLRLLVVGLGIGLTLALGLAFITRSQLYLTHALQVLHVGGGVGIVLGAALLATLVPAWRATRVDPVQTLRSE
jgi:ABC-type antimicrobial peptide transport system permease subunit